MYTCLNYAFTRTRFEFTASALHRFRFLVAYIYIETLCFLLGWGAFVFSAHGFVVHKKFMMLCRYCGAFYHFILLRWISFVYYQQHHKTLQWNFLTRKTLLITITYQLYWRNNKRLSIIFKILYTGCSFYLCSINFGLEFLFTTFSHHYRPY